MEFVGPGVCVGGSSGQAHPDVQERVMMGLSMLGTGPVKDLTSLLLSLCQMLRGLRTLPWPGTETQMGSSTHVISQGPQQRDQRPAWEAQRLHLEAPLWATPTALML